MVRIRETDYHHGAFTAALVNGGFQIELFETFGRDGVIGC